MKIGGIIAEYNPFHNGHEYQIKTFKEKYNISHVIIVMSGNFVQRGDVAIIDKFKRANMAIMGGADLVLELPVPYALSSAEHFARGGISILNSLGCVDTLCFGSTTDIHTLIDIAKISEELRNSKEVLSLMESGRTFPNALSEVVASVYNKDYSNALSEPNNVLGIEYIRALNFLNSTIEPITITRKNVQHNSTVAIENFASASYIRNSIYNDNFVDKFLSNYSNDVLNQSTIDGSICKLKNLENAILYKLRTSSIDEIKSITDVSQGLEYRIYQSVRSTSNLYDLLMSIKTKRYTLARIRRIILNLLIGTNKLDILTPPPYGRILAMNKNGIEMLSKANKSTKIPIDTSLARLKKISAQTLRFAELESQATDIYNISCDNPKVCGLDYTTKIIPLNFYKKNFP